MSKRTTIRRAQSLVAGALWLAAGVAGAADYPAQLTWAGKVALSTPVSGKVATVAVAPGQRVETGERLVALDARPFDARVERARARVEGIEPERDEAKRAFERSQELFDRTVLSEVELRQDEIAFLAVDADYRQARAGLALAKLDREYAEINAPFPARVLAVHVAPGEAVIAEQSARPLVEVARADRMRARVRVTAEQAAGVVLGDAARVSVGGEAFDAEVVAVAPTEDGYAVEVAFTGGEGLVAGQEAEVSLP